MVESKAQAKKRLTEERQKIDRELKALEVPESIQELAVVLHDAYCRYNHTDGCGWFYEIRNGKTDWTGWAHDRWSGYAKEANEVRESLGMTMEQTLDFIKRMKRFA